MNDWWAARDRAGLRSFSVPTHCGKPAKAGFTDDGKRCWACRTCTTRSPPDSRKSPGGRDRLGLFERANHRALNPESNPILNRGLEKNGKRPGSISEA